MKHMTLLLLLLASSTTAHTQARFELQFDHATVLVSDLDRSALFYEGILQLETLETPWGDAAPIRFFSLGGSRQLHVGVSERPIQPDKNVHVAFAVVDFDRYLRFLEQQGVAVTNFPGNSISPQVRPDGVRQVYLQDPDGNWIEINDASHTTPPSHDASR